MKVLVACEFSGVVRDAFRARGHDAWSCDLLPCESTLADWEDFHFQGNVTPHLQKGWDLMIAHPPCTHLAVSGARWFKDKQIEQVQALYFVRELLSAPIPRIALEEITKDCQETGFSFEAQAFRAVELSQKALSQIAEALGEK